MLKRTGETRMHKWKHNWSRVLLHFPWGLIAAIIYLGVGAPAGITALVGSCIYEGFNDWRKKDQSYWDVLGIIWGFTIPLLVLAIRRIMIQED